MTTDALPGSIAQAPVVLVPGLSGDAADDFSFLGPMLGRRRPVRPTSFDELSPSPTLEELVARVATAGTAAADATVTHPAETAPAPATATAPATALEPEPAPAVPFAGAAPVLIGYSLGAVAAALFAAEHPERVSALVLIAGWLEPSPKLRALASVWDRLAATEPDALAEVHRSALFSAEGWESAALPRVDARSHALLRLAATAGVGAAAARISVPALVIGCAHDEVATARQTRLLFAAIPDARYTEIESGHGVLRERPAEVLDLIDSFLAEPQRHPAGTIVERSRP